jgi:hypothetical protein
MPRGDGSGPAGFGPMTGRAAGYCAGYATPGFANPVPGFGRGRGMGYGGGRGRGGRGWAGGQGWGMAQPIAPFPVQQQQMDPQAEAGMLKQQAEALQGSLEQIKARLEALENGE